MNTTAASSRSTRRAAAMTATAALLGVLALAGCGSSSNSTSSATTATTAPATSPATTTGSAPAAGGSALSLAANPGGQLEYDKKELTAASEHVSIAFTNMSPLSHNVTVEGAGGKAEGATATFSGGTKTLSLTLKPGTYKFYCSVPGHRQAGMEGTLVVK